MDEIEAIRQRLSAVSAIDWAEVVREKEVEYYGDWVKVGPVMLQDFDPEDELTETHREQTRIEKRQQEAVVAFLVHAADDLAALLSELGQARADADQAWSVATESE